MIDFSRVPTGVIHRWDEEDRRMFEFAERLALRFGDTSDKTEPEKDESPDMPGLALSKTNPVEITRSLKLSEQWAGRLANRKSLC